MKKFTASIMCLFLVLSLSAQNAFALNPIDQSDIITFEEFSSALKDKFSEYGSELQIEQTDDTFVYTKQILKEELNKAETYLSSERADKQKSFNTWNSDLVDNVLNGEILRSAMPGTISKTNDTRVNLPTTNPLIFPATGTIQTTVVFNVDYQYNTIGVISTPSLVLTQGTYLADYIVLKGYSYQRNTSSTDPLKKNIVANITCELKREYAIPGGTSWEKVQHSYSTTFYPFR